MHTLVSGASGLLVSMQVEKGQRGPGSKSQRQIESFLLWRPGWQVQGLLQQRDR